MQKQATYIQKCVSQKSIPAKLLSTVPEILAKSDIIFSTLTITIRLQKLFVIFLDNVLSFLTVCDTNFRTPCIGCFILLNRSSQRKHCTLIMALYTIVQIKNIYCITYSSNTLLYKVIIKDNVSKCVHQSFDFFNKNLLFLCHSCLHFDVN